MVSGATVETHDTVATNMARAGFNLEPAETCAEILSIWRMHEILAAIYSHCFTGIEERGVGRIARVDSEAQNPERGGMRRTGPRGDSVTSSPNRASPGGACRLPGCG